MSKFQFPTTWSGGTANESKKWMRLGWLIASLLCAGILTVTVTRTASSAIRRGAPGAPDGGLSWTIESVENNRYFYEMTDRSLATYPKTGSLYQTLSNTLQYAYGGDHLYYAYFDGTSWANQVVDSNPGVGAYASIAVDKNNLPSIAYYDSVNGTLKFAAYNGFTWIILTLDSYTTPSSASSETRGPVDPAMRANEIPLPERPWIDPALAADFPALLVPDAVTQGVGQYTSIAIDSQGDYHISYYQFNYINDDHNTKLKYIHTVGGTWQPPEFIYESGAAGDKREGKYTSIAVDSHDHPHIVFLDDDYDDARHAYIGIHNRWNFENIYDFSNPKNVGGWLSLAIDGNNKCHVSFYNESNGDLRYASRPHCDIGDKDDPNYEKWSKVNLDSGGDVGKYTSLILKGSTAYISYFDETHDYLKLATSGGATSVITGNNDVHAGAFTSIVMDGQDRLHVTYLDFGKGELYEAYQNKNYVWNFRKIDENHDVGYATSLALDNSDVPFISYLDASSSDLKLAWRSSAPPAAGTWSNDKLEPTYDLGLNTSVKIDAGGNAHIAFYDSTNKNLIYAYWDTATWVTTTVDSTGDVGQFASLALDVNDNPFISYYDASNTRLLYAYWDTTEWITKEVDNGTELSVGKYSSIALDNTPQPNTHIFISYYDETNHNPKVAYYNSLLGPPFSTWRKYTVEHIADVDLGKYTSLALTAAFEPRLVYYEATNKYLRYAAGTWDGTQFVFTPETVQKITDYDIGQFCSLALDSSDRPNISYYSYNTVPASTDGDLMYARKVGPLWDIYTVDSEDDTGYFTSIAVDSSDVPSISYYDKTEGELKYAYDPYLPDYTHFIFLPIILQNP
jgi:hypothetical protein